MGLAKVNGGAETIWRGKESRKKMKLKRQTALARSLQGVHSGARREA